MCLIQLNYMAEHIQAGVEGLRYAAHKGLGVGIMEPLKGGRLAGNIPSSIMEIWDSTDVKRTPPQWALRWLYNFKEVSFVLSGMSSIEQIKENLEGIDEAFPGCLTVEEQELFNRIKQEYLNLKYVPCS